MCTRVSQQYFSIDKGRRRIGILLTAFPNNKNNQRSVQSFWADSDSRPLWSPICLSLCPLSDRHLCHFDHSVLYLSDWSHAQMPVSAQNKLKWPNPSKHLNILDIWCYKWFSNVYKITLGQVYSMYLWMWWLVFPFWRRIIISNYWSHTICEISGAKISILILNLFITD